jgi:hypothetical protein
MIKKITLVVTNKWGLLLLNVILLKNKILEGKWRLIIITNNGRKGPILCCVAELDFYVIF